jgi:glycosyltransferase involved in cell wall biosynthesis
MACATPVLTSNVSSLPEVVGDKAILCDPFDVNDIADGFYRLATDNSLCETLSREGYERSKIFSWDASARIMHEVYEKIVGGTQNK